MLALGKYLLGNRGIELDWEKEFISIPKISEQLTEAEDKDVPITEDGAQNQIKEHDEEGEDDWNVELRRRKRR